MQINQMTTILYETIIWNCENARNHFLMNTFVTKSSNLSLSSAVLLHEMTSFIFAVCHLNTIRVWLKQPVEIVSSKANN